MTTIALQEVKTDFQAALLSPCRSPEIPESADVYGWLIGSWELDVLRYRVDVSQRHIKAEAHFAWVLEGRAVQDLWIMPRRSERKAPLEASCNMYGTTLRVWDPSLQAWRVSWVNAVTGIRNELVGRWQQSQRGKEIVQIGTHPDGTPIRWMFSEITKDSFRWTGEVLEADGKTWTLQGEFRARRISQSL